MSGCLRKSLEIYLRFTKYISHLPLPRCQWGLFSCIHWIWNSWLRTAMLYYVQWWALSKRKTYYSLEHSLAAPQQASFLQHGPPTKHQRKHPPSEICTQFLANCSLLEGVSAVAAVLNMDWESLGTSDSGIDDPRNPGKPSTASLYPKRSCWL